MPALFRHTYLAHLQVDMSYDEAAVPIARELRDWLPSVDASMLEPLIDSWVAPVLDLLDLQRGYWRSW